MKRTVARKFYLTVLGAGISAAACAAGVSETHTVLFNRDVRPIFSDTCFPCHGFDANKRKANLRLDTAEGLVALRDGRQAVKGGDLDASELWRRVNTRDPKLIMPPPDSGKRLKPDQISMLRQWIEQGGVYQKHWAFEPPSRPEPPTPKNSPWARNEVDRFVLSTLEANGLSPAAEAPKEMQIRRVTLALTGLPPTPVEVDEFLADARPDAYERLVDRLLSSPRYGEQMARYWLDVARYGDTHGLHLDNERSLWPYRDWVVEAFNNNLSFDKFTVWQLAGDLLSNPTREQIVASGFNRCNVTTSEGGAIDEEFQVRYAVDRVETTSIAWMGLTMGCAVCHDHKLDPISQKEFYQVFSIFNNIAENAMDGNVALPPPIQKLPNLEQEKQLADFDLSLTNLNKSIQELVASVEYIDPATVSNGPAPERKELVWFDDEFPPKAEITSDGEPNKWISRSEGPVYSGEKSIRRSGKGVHQVHFSSSAEPLTVKPGDKLFAYVHLDPKDTPRAIMLQYHTKEWRNRAIWGDPEAIPFGKKGTQEKVEMGELPKPGEWVRLEIDVETLGIAPGTTVTGIAFTQAEGTTHWDKPGIVTLYSPAEDPKVSFIVWQEREKSLGDKSVAPKEIRELLKKEKDKIEEADRQKVREYFLTSIYADPENNLVSRRAEIKAVQEKRKALDKEITGTLVSKELEKPRPAWVLLRGEYDKHGESVGPGVPSVLPPLPQSDVTNRLAFAQWLVDPKHPLTARVTVNRLWQQFFGVGIVKTAEDFGTKGEWPSHPEFLDWMATEFIRTGWDVKQFVRLMVTSATYRQDSRVTPALLAADPENRLLARGPRFRLDAEELRDTALFTGGLLNLEVGGRGVRSYQPPGIWEAVGYTTSDTAKYTQDHGNALYRRSLYLFWKRTAPPPSMTTFDAPSREKCQARRERTNTPLQALLVMNDIQYFEAARHLGYRMLSEGGAEEAERLRYGFRLATARWPSADESAILRKTLENHRQRYSSDLEAARKVISVGESAVSIDVSPQELAAYTLVANLLLNLDEVLTRN